MTIRTLLFFIIFVASPGFAADGRWVQIDDECSVLKRARFIFQPELMHIEASKEKASSDRLSKKWQASIARINARAQRQHNQFLKTLEQHSEDDQKLYTALSELLLLASSGHLSTFSIAKLLGSDETPPSYPQLPGHVYDISDIDLNDLIAFHYGDETYEPIFEVAKQNHSVAQACMSFVKFYGIGTQRNLPEALAWAKLADLSLNPEGSDLYWYLEKNLSFEEKDEAETLYREFLEKYSDFYDTPSTMIVR